MYAVRWMRYTRGKNTSKHTRAAHCHRGSATTSRIDAITGYTFIDLAPPVRLVHDGTIIVAPSPEKHRKPLPLPLFLSCLTSRTFTFHVQIRPAPLTINPLIHFVVKTLQK